MRSAWRIGWGLFLASMVWLAQNAAAQECIDPSIAAELTSCSGARHAPRRPGSARTPRGGDPEPQRTAQAPEPGYQFAPQSSAAVRGERLLEREIEVLERLSRSTPQARRAAVLHRFAETLAELATVHEIRVRSFDEPIHRARTTGGDVRSLTERQRAAEARLRSTRERTVRVLAELVRDHPRYARFDEVLFTLAFYLEGLGMEEQARTVYHRLLRDAPDSRFVPQAYLAFAEHAFEQGNLDDARSFYERVIAIPPERNPVYGYARYKLAWVHVNAERWADALDAFVRVIEHANEAPDAPANANLARQARREIVLPYMRVGRIDRALAFFRRVASEDEAFEMFERLGEAYFDGGRWPQAIDVYQRLIAERPSDARSCAWRAQILDATISSRPKDEQVRAAMATAEARRTFRGPEDQVRACTERVATTLVLLATAWHREAIGTEDQPGTRDPRTMRHAAALYDLIDREIPELDRLTFETIEREDRPSRAMIAFFHAELLYSAEDWAGCARAYERALEVGAEGQLSADASYGVVLCYDRQMTREPPPAATDLTARELTESEARMERAFSRFACTAPDHEEIPIVLYRWARIHYEANRFAPAAVLFRRVAIDHPSSEVGEFAANLYLDSLNALARGGRASCMNDIYAAIAPLRERYCATPDAHPDLCHVIVGAECHSGAIRAEGLASHRDRARAYLALVGGGCEREDVYLHNAAEHFMAARLVGRAIRVLLALIEAHPQSEHARRAPFTIGEAYHAMAIYGEAATWYERYARANAEHPDAVDALHHAVVFRIGLGEEETAMDDARLFATLFRRSQPARTAQVAFAIGSLHEGAQRWSQLVDHHRTFLRTYRDVASPVEIARANVAMARAFVALDQRDRALSHLRTVVDIHERAEEAVSSDPTQVALLRDAVSEALYGLAEEERLRFEAIALPPLRGQASIARVNAWATGELQPWIAEKIAALRIAEAAYERLHPLGIPRWRIAGASRIGDMVMSIVSAVRNAPVPDSIAADEELLAIYWTALDAAVAPFEHTAVERYENCLQTATITRWFDDRSRRCEQALNALDTVRYPIAAELRGAPSYTPRAPAEPGVPLDG